MKQHAQTIFLFKLSSSSMWCSCYSITAVLIALTPILFLLWSCIGVCMRSPPAHTPTPFTTSFCSDGSLELAWASIQSVAYDIVSTLAAGAFSPGVPATFLSNYGAAMRFLEQLEGMCTTRPAFQVTSTPPSAPSLTTSVVLCICSSIFPSVGSS